MVKKYLSIALSLIMIVTLFGACSKEKPMSLTNQNASEATVKVYDFICDAYKNEVVITGQQESTWIDGPEYEMNFIYDATGKYPAIRGLDFMNDDFDGVVERSINWWNKGGIVSICWHCGPDFSGNYDNCRYDDIDDWDKVLTDGTDENKAFIANMDKAGEALKRLRDAGVPVLWRPFHEFDGDWFWWSRGGEKNFKKLWIMMYNHFTNDLELNNLIWVLGYSHNGKDYKGKPVKWYPGDEYCDIVGADTYEVDVNGAEQRLYDIVVKIAKNKKPLIMHECGQIPTIDQFSETPWCAFMTWHSEFLIDTNDKATLSDIYNSDKAVTLDELPDF